MQLSEIEVEWEKDSKIDRANLDTESLRVPELHNKYYKMYIREKLLLEKMHTEEDVLTKLKYEYYSGKLDEFTLKEKGWKQFDLLVLKADMDKYMQADQDVIAMKLRIAGQKEKVHYLESIISTLNNRSFHIKNAIEFIKFSQGN